MISKIISKYILMPLYLYKTDNHSLKRLSMLEKSQYLTADELRNKQLADLKKILDHCYINVPFYRERFAAAGFNPSNFKDFSDIRCIPYLTKEDLQNNLPRLVATNFSKEDLVLNSSGGSTGKPTNFYKDLSRHYEGWADSIRHDRWSGWDLGEKCVKLWGAQREFETQNSWTFQMVEKYAYRIYGFNAFDISEKKILQYIDELKTIKPTMILAYSNVAYLFAKIIEKNNIDLRTLHLKGIICSAETLTEQMRTVIESSFCCKVLNRYGSREVGLIASECHEQDGLHVNMDSIYLEIEKGGEVALPGEPGEIIITDLWNYGMPFIRYQTGDVGSASSHLCRCGRNLTTINGVQGRVSDFFVDAKGGLVHGEYFTHLFYELGGIEQFQIVQETVDKISVNILPGKDFTLATLDPVVKKIKQCIGGGVTVDIKIRETSFVEASGKFRFTISKVSNGYFRDCV